MTQFVLRDSQVLVVLHRVEAQAVEEEAEHAMLVRKSKFQQRISISRNQMPNSTSKIS